MKLFCRWGVIAVIAAITINACKKDEANPQLPSATGTIRGKVVNANGNTVLPGATVVTSPPTATVVSDAQGGFSITRVNPGQYIVLASKSGYIADIDTVTVKAGQTDTAGITMLSLLGLAAYYPLDANALDESGNGNHGTLYGPTTTSDRFGRGDRALMFNGTNNYIVISHSASLNIPHNLTVVGWCYMTTSSWGRLVRKINTWGLPVGGYILTAGSNFINAELQLTTSGNGVTIARKDTALALNRWHFVAMSYDGTGVSLYLNGTRIYSMSASGLINPNTYNVYIGSSEGVEFFTGKIDDIRIFSRALTESEILFLFHENGWGF